MNKRITILMLIVLLIICNISIADNSETSLKTDIIEEGVYEITSAINSSIAFDITDGSSENGAEIQLWENLYADQQKFIFKYHDDGFYTIQSKKTNKYITVVNSSWGESIRQFNEKNDDSQKWILKRRNDGTYSIISKIGNVYIDVPNWNCNNGVKLQLWGNNENVTAQRFNLVKETQEIGNKIVEDGSYRILVRANTIQAFDIDCGSDRNGAKAQIWQDYNKLQQKFEVKYTDNGYYKIVSKNSKKVLTINNKEARMGTQVVQEEDKNLDTQLWIIKEIESGVYQFVSKINNLPITVENANNGKELFLGKKGILNCNQFILVNEDVENYANTTIRDGYYNITLVENSNKTIDISGGSYNEDANIQIWDRGNVQQQKFYIKKVPNQNYYKITAMNSSKNMQVQYASIYNDSNVNQGNQLPEKSQEWYFVDCGNGYINIISRLNYLYVQTDNIAQNGSNIKLSYKKKNNEQKFKLKETNALEPEPVEIETKLSNNRVLDIDCGSYNNRANLQIWEPQNKNQERFVVENIDNQYYKIKNVNSGKVLTVEASGNVSQYEYNGGNNQQWAIIPRGENYYSFESKSNGYYMDVDNANSSNGTNVKTWWNNGNEAQKFKTVSGYRKFYEQGSYGTSGKMQANQGGYELPYYKIGRGSKHLFMAFSIHGFEDSYSYDGAELTYIANQLRDYLYNYMSEGLVNNWTIYIFPVLNPDGQYNGWTNNGPGRTTLYSYAPNNRGIDMNRCWSIGFKRMTSSRNYTGTWAFQAPEAAQLRDFILNHQGSNNIVIDTHGWLNETIGDNWLGYYYRNEFGISKHIYSYGNGYFINWARSLSNTRSMLLELPEVNAHWQTIDRDYSGKFIRATLKMLEEN